MTYKLKWRGGAEADGTEGASGVTRIWLVGPFDDDAAACAWAEANQASDGDDPRWQLVHPNLNGIEVAYTLAIYRHHEAAA